MNLHLNLKMYMTPLMDGVRALYSETLGQKQPLNYQKRLP